MPSGLLASSNRVVDINQLLVDGDCWNEFGGVSLRTNMCSIKANII